jgi:hypothetical protein
MGQVLLADPQVQVEQHPDQHAIRQRDHRRHRPRHPWANQLVAPNGAVITALTIPASSAATSKRRSQGP